MLEQLLKKQESLNIWFKMPVNIWLLKRNMMLRRPISLWWPALTLSFDVYLSYFIFIILSTPVIYNNEYANISLRHFKR